jgi:hypothetical protein
MEGGGRNLGLSHVETGHCFFNEAVLSSDVIIKVFYLPTDAQ